MRTYDYKRAIKTIQTYSDYLESASLGMKEDWYWTAITVYEDNSFTMELDKPDTKIAGIDGSAWATPALQLKFKDGREMFLDCYEGAPEGEMPEWVREWMDAGMGPMSGTVQSEINRKTGPKAIESDES